MIFLLLRVWPFFLAIFYLLMVTATLFYSGHWYWWLLSLLAGDIFYFVLLAWKKDLKTAAVFFLQSILLILAGFFYPLFLSNRSVIVVFLALATLIFGLYLEAIFHFFYQTKKAPLLDLKNIFTYLNLTVFFLLNACWLNAYIFLDFAWYWPVLSCFAFAAILIYNRLILEGVSGKFSLFYALVLACLLTEILVSLLFLPFSFYVLSLLLTSAYYLLVSLSVFKIKEKLTWALATRYSLLALSAVVLVMLTAAWF